MFVNVKGFEGLYLVNEEGIIKSIERNGTIKGGRIMKHSNDKDGYKLVKLRDKKRVVTGKVHRIVAEAFVPNPENKPQVNHKDCDKTNNHYQNLEWVTNRENINHSMINGLVPEPKNKVKINQIKDGIIIKTFNSYTEAQKETGIRWTNISACVRKYRGRKSAGGFQWERSTTRA